MAQAPGVAITIDYFAPSEALRDMVTFHYVLRSDDPVRHEPLSALLGQALFVLSGGARYHFAEGAQALQACSLCGPMMQGVDLEMWGPSMSVGAGLLPLGWATLVRAAAGEIADGIVDASEVWGASALHLWERLATAPSDRQRCGLLDRFLLSKLAVAELRGSERVAAVDAWVAEGGAHDPRALAAALGVSQRQAARIALESHGAPPRLLAQKYRALRTAVGLATGGASRWREGSGEDAFADQSHYIREFRRFVGVTPSQFAGDGAHLMRDAMARRWQAGVTNPLALWS